VLKNSLHRGVAAMIAAMALFTGNDTCVKLLSSTLPTGQIMVVRGVFAVLLAALLLLPLWWRRGSQLGHALQWRETFKNRSVLVRVSLEMLSAFAFITSVAVLPLANATTLFMATPLLMATMLSLFTDEKLDRRAWGLVILGFLGVVLIVRPNPYDFQPIGLFALFSAFTSALRDLVTRTLPKTIPTETITFLTTLGVFIAGFIIGARETWQPLSALTPHLPLLIAAAVFLTLGNLAVVFAFRGTPVAVISPFRYTAVPVSVIAGLLFFGDIPDGISFIGMALIVGCGWLTLQRMPPKEE
jgi:drug/metabolite transporter (DMT)-like permease